MPKNHAWSAMVADIKIRFAVGSLALSGIVAKQRTTNTEDQFQPMSKNDLKTDERVASLIKRIAQWGYNRTVRPVSPRVTSTYAGIPTPGSPSDPRAVRITDFTKEQPDYKKGLLDAIRDHVSSGDDIGIIGLGRGVSTVYAVRSGGVVTAYEAAAEMIEVATTTLQWQGIEDDVDIIHGVVGAPGGSIYGEKVGERISPAELNHDILVMDCEGAEVSIIESIAGVPTRPETIIVECHPEFDAGLEAVRSSLATADFAPISRSPIHPESEKQVVVAKRK